MRSGHARTTTRAKTCRTSAERTLLALTAELSAGTFRNFAREFSSFSATVGDGRELSIQDEVSAAVYSGDPLLPGSHLLTYRRGS
jgi:hypothetical protein